MNNEEELLIKIKNYEDIIFYLENELNKTKEHLKKYTAPSNMKKYYENHKEEIKQKVKEYKENATYMVSKEVIAERNKRAYQKRKEIYKIIRKNGGWNNWDMVEIATHNCKNFTEARIKEQEYYQLLKATLNSNCPYKLRTKKADISNHIPNPIPNHIPNHIPNPIPNHIPNHIPNPIPIPNDKKLDDLKTPTQFCCLKCDYNTTRKLNYERHIQSNKHKHKLEALPIKVEGFKCICGNTYKYSQGLSKHKNMCELYKNNKIMCKKTLIPVTSEYILQIIMQNHELTNLLMQQNIELNNATK